MPRSPLRGARKIFQERDLSENDGKKTGLALSWPILGATALFLAGAIAWAFFMGFMVGQGHNPNVKLQELTGITIPAPDTEQAEDPPESQAAASPRIEENLAPNPSPAPEKTAAAFRTPKGKELNAWGEEQKTPAPSPKKEKPVRQKKEELFNFTFQVAACKNLADAEKLQKKLAQEGIKAKIQKSGKVQLVIANFRGPASAPENFQKKMLSLKLGKPLQLSKKPLSNKTARNK